MTAEVPSGTDLQRVIPVLLKAAATFSQKEREQIARAEDKTLEPRCPLLIIDNINHLATGDANILRTVQDLAKDHADCGDLIVIFVSSEGQAPEILAGVFLFFIYFNFFNFIFFYFNFSILF